jgi:radical SAM-linked protein
VSALKIRIKFAKTGSMKFIGHLDIMRYFQKVMRRAKVDIAYSEGFSPHQKMSFAAPLGVGLTSCGEYFDIEVHSTDASKEMLRRINDAMVEGMEVLSYVALPEDSKNAMSLVAAADYEVTIREGYLPELDFASTFTAFMDQPVIEILKTTKKSQQMVDIKPMILNQTLKIKEDGTPVFQMQLATGSVSSLKPELVMQAYYQYAGLEYVPMCIETKRLELYGEQDGKLLPLEAFGVEVQ